MGLFDDIFGYLKWAFTGLEFSVGTGGRNRRDDVKKVQILLNAHPNQTGARLAQDSIFGPKTKAAIWEFQRREVKGIVPDGRVDPGGATITALYKGISSKTSGLPKPPKPSKPSTKSNDVGALIDETINRVKSEPQFLKWRTYITTYLERTNSVDIQNLKNRGIVALLFGQAEIRYASDTSWSEWKLFQGHSLRANARVNTGKSYPWQNDGEAVIIFIPDFSIVLLKPNQLIIVKPKDSFPARRSSSKAHIDVPGREQLKEWLRTLN